MIFDFVFDSFEASGTGCFYVLFHVRMIYMLMNRIKEKLRQNVAPNVRVGHRVTQVEQMKENA